MFTLACFLIALGIVLVYQGILVREVYLLGICLMIVFIVGYAAWHSVLAHGDFWPYIESHGHKDLGPVELFVAHALTDTVGIVSKVLEMLLGVVLSMFYILDRSASN